MLDKQDYYIDKKAIWKKYKKEGNKAKKIERRATDFGSSHNCLMDYDNGKLL